MLLAGYNHHPPGEVVVNAYANGQASTHIGLISGANPNGL